MNGKCPRCSTPITTPPDARGLVHCTACGTWLRSVSPAPPAPAPAAAASAPAAASSGSERAPAAVPPPAPSAAEPPPLAAVAPTPEIQALIAEIRDLRRMQAEILQLQAQVLTAVRSWPPPAPAPAAPAEPGVQRTPGATDEVEILDEDDVFSPHAAAAPAVPRVRQRRKTVLLVDDDPATRQDAVSALEQAQVPIRSVDSGQAAVAAVAAERPDVIVLELDMGGAMPGRDFINMLKATMEWVDIPLLLYTRLPIGGSKEARIQYGADDFVLKGPGAAEALVNHVIATFQRK